MNQPSQFRSCIADPGLEHLYDHWGRLVRKLGRLPYRPEIDPLDLPRAILPTMLVLEREVSGRFRCRLAGTMLTSIYDFEPTGWYLDEIMPPAAAGHRVSLYERCLDEKRAVLCRRRFAIPGREFIASDRLYVPVLGESADRATVLFGAQRFYYSSEVTGEPDEHGIYYLWYDDPVAD